MRTLPLRLLRFRKEAAGIDKVNRVITIDYRLVGWSFHFPSSAEAMLWRVSSAVLTGIAFLFPTFFVFMGEPNSHRGRYFLIAFYSIIILVYVVSRLLLLVEAFISLRHLTSGMLALVEWTSFIPHI